MARHRRIASPTGAYHFINRGVNKKNLFHRSADYEFYLALIGEYSKKLNTLIYHYCLMSNHTHLLLRTDNISALSGFGHFIQRRYAYYYCKTHHWSEQVFRKRFVSIPVEDDRYLLECGRYIERNPLRAGLVKWPEEYPYSSYGFYGAGNANDLLTSSPAYEALAITSDERQARYRAYVADNRPYEALLDKVLMGV